MKHSLLLVLVLCGCGALPQAFQERAGKAGASCLRSVIEEAFASCTDDECRAGVKEVYKPECELDPALCEEGLPMIGGPAE